MANESLIEPSVLRQLMDYNPDTGRLVWLLRGPEWFAAGRVSSEGRSKCWNAKHSGQEAFAHRNRNGYRYAKILGQLMMGHRIVFAHVHRRWPVEEIDHINGVRDDNRICNLREADRTTNNRNRRHAKGYLFEAGRRLPWRAYIGCNSRQVGLGGFATEAEAATARRKAEDKYGYGNGR